ARYRPLTSTSTPTPGGEPPRSRTASAVRAARPTHPRAPRTPGLPTPPGDARLANPSRTPDQVKAAGPPGRRPPASVQAPHAPTRHHPRPPPAWSTQSRKPTRLLRPRGAAAFTAAPVPEGLNPLPPKNPALHPWEDSTPS